MSRRTSPKPPRTDVRVLSRWNGFCLPCGSSERPLVLVWSGPASARARLLGPEAGTGQLRLTCGVCGGTDLVGWEDEPEPAVGWDAPALDLTVPGLDDPTGVLAGEPAVVEPVAGVVVEVAVEPAVAVVVEPAVAEPEPVAGPLEDVGLELLLAEPPHVPLDDPADAPPLVAEPLVAEPLVAEPLAVAPPAHVPVVVEPVVVEPVVVEPLADGAPVPQPAPQPYVPGLSADVAAALRELAAPAVPAPRGSDDLEALVLLDGER